MNKVPPKVRHHPIWRFIPLRGLAIPAASLFLAGCAVEIKGHGFARVDKALEARGKPSLEPWRHAVKNSGLILRDTAVRSALLIGGCETKDVFIASTSSGRSLGKWRVSVGADGPWEASTAVPVTADGYFLTAGHCTESGPLTIVTRTRRSTLEKHAARVVWSRVTPDLALLHAPMEIPSPLFLDQGGSLQPKDKDPVASYGFSELTGAGGRFSAGRILAISPPRKGPSGEMWRVIYHDAPLLGGDSGGPLVSSKGHLVGVNSLGQTTWFAYFRAALGLTGSPSRPLAGYHSQAIAPDPDWLRSLIDKDRATASSRSAGLRNAE